MPAAVSGTAAHLAEEWRTRARAFVEREIVPLAEAMDQTDRLPDSIRPALAREGYLGFSTPKEWGGLGGDTRSTAAVLEELSSGSAAVATMVAVQLSVVEGPLVRWGTDEQKEHYLRPLASGTALGAFALTEPGAGSDAASLQCRYSRAGDHFLLNGTKTFITNAASADTVLVFATRDPTRGAHGTSAFLLARGEEGFDARTTFDKLGIRGSDTAEIHLKDVRVPLRDLLGEEGSGLRIALEALTNGRVGIAACALGVARAAYDELLTHTRSSPDDGNRTRVARSYVELQAARALIEQAAAARDAGAPFVEQASAAKLLASRVASEVTTRALEAAGRAGVAASSRANRLWRDARVFPIVEGTSEIQELILGRELLGPRPASDSDAARND